jgi:hypothetical protein
MFLGEQKLGFTCIALKEGVCRLVAHLGSSGLRIACCSRMLDENMTITLV